MQADEVMDLMRHARHDWMNQLQLIQGYIAMGKMDRVKGKLDEVLAIAEEERHLMNLNAPYLSLWLISFNWHHPYFRITYAVNGGVLDLRHKDITLYAQCKEIVRIFERYSDSSSLYQGVIAIEVDKHNFVEIELAFKGEFDEVSILKEALSEKDFISTVEIEGMEQYHQVTAKMNVEVKR